MDPTSSPSINIIKPFNEGPGTDPTSDPETAAVKDEEGPEFSGPLTIMLLGKSGAGKSSSGNTILGRRRFNSDLKLENVTVTCERGSGPAGDAHVSVIDTPGFFEAQRDKEAVLREILQCLKLQEPGPHAFVYVIPIGRMTREDRDTARLIESSFGPRVWRYTVALFTHGDRLAGRSLNHIVAKSDDHLRDFLRKCGGGFHVFDNRKPDDGQQVETLVSKIRTLVALNGGRPYETRLYPPAERRIRERHQSILDQRSEAIGRLEENLRSRYQDQELEENLRSRYQDQELEDQLSKLWRDEDVKARRRAEVEMKRKGLLELLPLALVLVVLCLNAGWALGSWLYMVVALVLGLVGFCYVFPQRWETLRLSAYWKNGRHPF